MRLTVLGKYGPYPGKAGACSGYLLEEKNTKVLVDCGNGVLSRLQQICDLQDLDAIVLSHLHSDHMSDMMVLRYALDIWRMRGLLHGKALPVYLPQNPLDDYERIIASKAYQPRTIHDGMRIDIGELTLSFHEMTHPIQSFGMIITNGVKKIVYTGDTNYNAVIEKMAFQADFFFADTGLLEKDKIPGKTPHLTAEEVGKIAARAKVKQLMLTHIYPGYQESELVREASKYYPGLIVAEEMKVYEI